MAHGAIYRDKLQVQLIISLNKPARITMVFLLIIVVWELLDRTIVMVHLMEVFGIM